MNKILMMATAVAVMALLPTESSAIYIEPPAYSGQATLTLMGAWLTDDITLTYSVYSGSGDDEGLWLYTYCWDGETPGISHAIIQVTDDLTENDLVLDSSSGEFEVGDQVMNSGSPNLPWPFYGVKFDELGDEYECFSIISSRNPVSGYFYAKGGGGPRLGEAWARDILRPNGPPVSVPDHTATVAALGLGLWVVGGLRRRMGC